MSKVAILGAGVAGLSSAWLLKQRGIEFSVFEKQSHVGGLARSFLWNGFACDFAAHRLFTTNENILHELLKLVPMGRHVRRSKIYLKGHWLHDPLDVLELSTHLSVAERLKILWAYLFRPRNLNDDNFESYVLRRYGKGLYGYFFKPYTEKLFGIPGDEISVLWAQQKVRLANPLDALHENTKNKFQYFYYPIQKGYGAIVDALYADVQENVFCNVTVKGIESNNDQITSILYEQNGNIIKEEFDAVISTLPLTITGQMLGYRLALKYRKVDAVYLHINRPSLSDYHWIYFIDDSVAINRLVEFKNMSAVDAPASTTVVCAEVTQDHDNLVEKVIHDLAQAGLLKSDEVLDSLVVREEYAYPVYDRTYDEVLHFAQEKLGQYVNLFTIGRAAEFRHREVDDNFAAAVQRIPEIISFLEGQSKPLKPVLVEKPSAEEITMEPLVIGVVLAWNNYSDTRECLQTLFASDYPNLQAILVDNGSEDGTPERARQEFPALTVIENGRNLGVPAGYNIGFIQAIKNHADYVLMLNNDVAIPPDMLSVLVKIAEDDPDTGIVMPKILYYGSSSDVWSSGGKYRAFPPAILMTDKSSAAADKLRMIEFAPSCGLLIHQRAFERAGLFDPGYLFLFDDWDFSQRVRANGLKIWYTPTTQMWHKVSRSTKGPSSPKFWRTMASSSVRYYRRHSRFLWLALPLHIGYLIAREFIWKRNWIFWPDFWDGIVEGLQKPLGPYPSLGTPSNLDKI
jgi:protoporphyrinogen oxidase/GT2 family glycosyltransferase